jgi:hypothetical protein
VSERPQARALLAALCHDLAGIRAQFHRLSDDELSVLPGAIRDVAIELRFTHIIQTGTESFRFKRSLARSQASRQPSPVTEPGPQADA